jgi:hypothetical protein
MTVQKIALGDVVRDRFGQTGIVCTAEPDPPKKWIDGLVDSSDVKALGKTEWWGVLAFGGGYLLSAGPLLVVLRRATYEDFLAAADTAKSSGRERLIRIFPGYVDRLMAERSANPDGA